MRNNDQHCHHLLDRLVSALHLEFVPAKLVTDEGWYVWRNSPDWPIDEYAVFEVVDGEMRIPKPADSYGAIWEMNWIKAHGELAGPIIGC